MLTIGKLRASEDQLEYYEQQVAEGIEDYFSGRGEAPGRWVGAGCARIGIPGRVDRDGFMRAMQVAIRAQASGSSPSTGAGRWRPLTSRSRRRRA